MKYTRILRPSLPCLYAIPVASLVLTFGQSTEAAVKTWENVPTGNWTTGGSWVGGTVPANSLTTDSALFANNLLTTASVNVNSNRSIKGIAFDITNASVTFSGGYTLNLGASGLTNAGNLGHNFLTPVGLSAAGIPINTGSGTFLFQGANILTGSGGLIKSGTGGILLAGPSTHTGDTVLSAGSINLESFYALQNSTLDTGTTGTRAVTFRYAAGQDIENDPGFEGTYHFGGLKGSLNLSVNSTDVGSGGETGARSLSVGANNSSNTYGGVLSGDGSFTKVGSGIQTLSGNNTYDGATQVAEGTLLVNGNQSAANGALTVAASAVLGGDGTVGGVTTVDALGTHAPGAVGMVGTQSFSSSLAYVATSIFEWDLNASTSDPGANSNNSGLYDMVVADGNITGNSVFNVVLGTNTYADSFWNTNKTWTNIFTSTSGTFDLSTLFTTYAGAGLNSDGTVPYRGWFTMGSPDTHTLYWTAIPEPTGALAGLLVGAGLLRRRRQMLAP
jgi:autotransporter-associated beta strand protein